jgi:hypothetical protein
VAVNIGVEPLAMCGNGGNGWFRSIRPSAASRARQLGVKSVLAGNGCPRCTKVGNGIAPPAGGKFGAVAIIAYGDGLAGL